MGRENDFLNHFLITPKWIIRPISISVMSRSLKKYPNFISITGSSTEKWHKVNQYVFEWILMNFENGYGFQHIFKPTTFVLNTLFFVQKPWKHAESLKQLWNSSTFYPKYCFTLCHFVMADPVVRAMKTILTSKELVTPE